MWTKGPRCGVDNCPSRFWQVIHGSKVCQNGHVQEGVERAADDDDFITGHKIKKPRIKGAKKETETILVFGRKALALCTECLQLVLQAQVSFLTENYIKHPQFEETVRTLWLTYAQIVHGNSKGGLADLGLAHTVAILYWSCLTLKIPIYTVDFSRWIYRYQLPYMDSLRFIPHEMREKLPNTFERQLRPSQSLPQGRLQDVCNSVLNILCSNSDFTIPPFMIEPLLFKTTRDLLMPPFIYTAARRILQMVDVATEFRVFKVFFRKSWPEMNVYCAVIAAIKLCFGFDDDQRAISPDTAAADQPDWELWRDLMAKTWLMDDEFADADERVALYWDQEKAARFTDWFQFNYLEIKSRQQPRHPEMLVKRLHNLFPLEPITKPVHSDFADLNTLKEFGNLLSATTEPPAPTDADAKAGEGEGEEDEDEEDEGEDEDEGELPAPGFGYRQYNRTYHCDWTFPELADTLYHVVAKFSTCSIDDLRQVSYFVEMRFRDANLEVFKTLEKEKRLVSRPEGVRHHRRQRVYQ